MIANGSLTSAFNKIYAEMLERQEQSRLNRALLREAENGHSEEIIRELIQRGADPNARDWSGNTALLLAAKNPSSEKRNLMTAIYDYGGDLDTVNRKGLGLEDVLNQQRNGGALKKFAQHMVSPEALGERLIDACEKADIFRAHHLMKRGADVNFTKNGKNPLIAVMLASAFDEDAAETLGEMLLKNKADLRKGQTEDGKTPAQCVELYAEGKVLHLFRRALHMVEMLKPVKPALG